MHEEGKRCKQAAAFIKEHRPWANLTAEGIKMAAKGFSPTTACTDGLPPKGIGWLSQGLLEGLAEMGNLWVEKGRWPTNEQTVHIALIPKPTGGERPIGLFRSIVRVICKAVAWDGLKWFEAQDIPQLNTSKGRRIGDAIWRAQMRSQIGEPRYAGEVMIDLMKAFEFRQPKEAG